MATKRKTKIAAQVRAKAQKPSTYAAISGLAAGLAPILAAIFPAHALAINGTAAAVGVLAGTYGTLKGVPTEQDAP